MRLPLPWPAITATARRAAPVVAVSLSGAVGTALGLVELVVAAGVALTVISLLAVALRIQPDPLTEAAAAAAQADAALTALQRRLEAPNG